LSGTVSAALTLGQKVNVYDGAALFDAVATVNGTTWSFTPATPLSNGAHSFTVEVAGVDGTPGPRSAPYAITIDSSSVSSVVPGEIVRTLTGSFDIAGRDLPTSGLSVTVPGDPKATCQSPNNMTAAGFGVACTFYKLGAQALEVRTATKLIGTVQVTVKSNVTGVTWVSPSTTNSGTVKFGETVTFKVAGVNLLADPVMGFAVQLCGVSNAEAGAGSDTQRTFTCNFNNVAGAVAGQMPGVVKDAPGGQVLFDGWSVPVEVPAAAGTINLPATSFVRGENVALSANGYGADTLMNAPPYGNTANAAEWDFTVATAGTYELFAEYAAALSRPVVISFNGAVKFNSALSAVTGGWFPADRQVISQGTVQLTAGATTMRIARGDVFPHIKGFRLVRTLAATEGLVGYWSFDNCDGRDSSANANHGAVSGAPVCVAGKIGNGLRFNGSTDWIVVPSSASFPKNAITLSYWVHRENNAIGAVLQNYLSKDLAFQSYLMDNGALTAGLWLGTPGFWTQYGSANTTPLPTLTDWVHFAFTYENTTRRAKLYVNGVLMSDAVDADARAIVRESGNALYLGRNSSANVYHIRGVLDEVRIYDRALSSQEVGQLFSPAAQAGASTAVASAFDDFLESTISSTRWNIVGQPSVANGVTQFPALSRINTQGKVTFSGNRIVVEARLAGQGASRDTSMMFVDTESGDYIYSGDTNYSDWGFFASGGGA
jgi:Concanavalin A-like lectin/glucanases superfamily